MSKLQSELLEAITLGTTLRMRRMQLGLSIYEAAKRTGINHHVIAHIEQGRTEKPNAVVVLQLAKLYGLSVEELAGVRQVSPDLAFLHSCVDLLTEATPEQLDVVATFLRLYLNSLALESRQAGEPTDN